MSKQGKLLWQILRADDASIRFADLCNLLPNLGLEERTRGSHHLSIGPGADEFINRQRDGSKAKPYQVRQVRRVLLRSELRTDD